jgi:IclR family acetate operon transcriptional repressor
MAYRIQSVERCFEVIVAIAQMGGAARLPALQRATGLPLPTVYRFLSVLCNLGYVHRAENGTYLLGYNLYRLGDRTGEYQLVRRLARPHLLQLAHRFDVTVSIAFREATQIVVFDRVTTEHSVKLPVEMSARLDAHSTALGKAMLAFVSPRLVATLYAGFPLRANTNKTVTSAAMLQRRLNDIRTTRIALDDEETFTGIGCVAIPLADREGRVLSAISASAPAPLLNSGLITALSIALKDVASEISAALCPDPTVETEATDDLLEGETHE